MHETTRTAARARLAGALLAAAIAAGCTAFDTPDTYNRHRLSDITLPRDTAVNSEIFYFDVSVTAEFPDSGEWAEAERMKWLAEWLEQRHMCESGHEVLKKRKFDMLEDNPARRDLRYEVRCKPAAAGG